MTYPNNWPEIARRIKDKWHWRCERCGHPDDRPSGHVLTVHHLVMDTSINDDFNLAVLCQRCHLHVQGTVRMAQGLLFPDMVADWFKPHFEGYKEWMRKEDKKMGGGG